MVPNDSEAGPGNGLEVRASDRERERVVSRLHEAVTEGRLTLAEFSDRSAGVYASRTRAELDGFCHDLPATGSPSVVEPAAGDAVQHLGIGAVKRRGRWRLLEDNRIEVGLGTIKLDLCDAELTAPEVRVHAETGLGTIKIYVPEGIRVEVTGSTGLGGRAVEENHLPSDIPAPTVRMRLDTGIGTVKVIRVKESERHHRRF